MADFFDETIPVTAHGLLNSMAVVLGALTLLHDSPALTPDERQDLLTKAIRQAGLVSASLKDLVQGLPSGATALVEELDRREPIPALVELDRDQPARGLVRLDRVALTTVIAKPAARVA